MSKPSPWWPAPAAADSAGTARKINVQLKPVGVRKSTSDQVIARLRRKTSGMPGRQSCSCRTPRTCASAAGRATRNISTRCRRRTSTRWRMWGPKVLDAALARFRRLRTSAPTSRIPGLSSNVVIDRDTASRLGLTAQAVDSALYDAFGQRQVSVMYKSINQYHVVLALQQQWWESPDFLNTIYVQTPRGTDVPLSTFTHFTQGITPISLPHQGQFPATTISFNLRRGRLAERRRDRHQPGGSGDGPARQHHRQVRRHRAGLSGRA